MNSYDWPNVVAGSFAELWTGIVNFLPNILIALLIFIVGWAIGAILGRAVAEIINRLKLDDALRSAGLEKVVRRAGFRLDVGAFIGGIVKWFIIIVFLIAALDILNLTEVTRFLESVVVNFLPQLVVAVFILLAGAVVAEAMQNVVVASARSAGLRSAHFLGVITRWAIWIFAALAALSELGIASVFIQTFFTGIMIAIGLAFGLAFGLGGRDLASRYLEKMQREVTQKEDNRSL